MLTSATTFVGFLSLAFTPSASVQHVAVALSIGVASALVLALTISPIVLSRLQSPAQPHKSLLGKLCNRPIRWFVDGCKRASLTYPRAVLIVSAVLVLACIVGISRIELDVDFPARFPSNHRVGRGVRVMNDRFQGANSIDLIIDYADSTMTLERLADLARIETALGRLPEITRAATLPRVLNAVDRSLGFDSKHERTPQQLQATLNMLRSSGGLEQVVSADGRKIRVALQIEATRIFAIADLARRVERIASAELMGREWRRLQAATSF